MNHAEIIKMGALEDDHWWFTSLRKIVLNLLQEPSSPTILDAGCGTGALLKLIENTNPESKLFGIDLSTICCSIAQNKSKAQILVGSIEKLPFPDNKFDIVICLDVLEYFSDPRTAISELVRVLKKDGTLVINVPAFNWLYSYHDIAVGQQRRFNKGELNGLLTRKDLKIKFQTYWNFFLFPIMILKRKLTRNSTQSDVSEMPSFLNTLFKRILNIEINFINRKISFPFGGSLLTIITKLS